MMRRALGVIVGVAVAMLTITLVEMIGHQLFPPPPGADMRDPAQVAQAMALMPFAAKLWVTLAWFLGSLAGALAGLAVSRWSAVAWIVAAFVIAGAIWSYTVIAHPLWMQAAGLLLPLLAAWIALRLHPAATNRST
jgi:hypothetical protein